MRRGLGPRRAAIVSGALLAFILLAGRDAFALNPALDVSQYAHTSWKIRDGFFKSPIASIAQTPDGYLWLGTEFGLFRFDGVRNVLWQPAEEQHLPSDWIFSLLAARDGTLWIGTAKGLASWKDGKLTTYAELANQYIFRLLEDREGTIWAGGAAIPTGKLCAITNGSVQCYGDDGSLGRGVTGLSEDSKGNVWVGVETGLWRWKPGPPKFYPLTGAPNGIRALGEDDDGALLVGLNGAIHRFVDGKTQAYPLAGNVGQFTAKEMRRDRDGGLWIATQERGLVHVHQGRTDVFAPSDGLSGEDIFTIFEDREGNIWVATINGLDRFREFAVTTFSVKQGLSNAVVGSVLAARDGSVWLSTFGGLNRWNNGQITIFGRSTGTRDGTLNGFNPHSLFQDEHGRIWVSTGQGVGYLEGDRFISITGVPGGNTLSIIEDTAGNLWIANEGFGLFHVLRGGAVQKIPWAGLGHKDHASALAADPLQGGIWLGFHLGGVAYFSDDHIRASYTAVDGLGEGRVNHLRLDRDGALWVATDSGLSRLKSGHIATLTSKNGLPCDAVHWSMEDNTRSLWLKTACGLVHVARPELDTWAAAVDKDKDAKPTMQVTLFDSSDGARIVSGGTHYSPPAARYSDGKLWFAGLGGVNVVDPQHIPLNKVPPPVHIEQITADRKTYDVASEVNGRLNLPPLVRDLQIDYTALSLVAPEKILFRYMLEGRDSDWQEAGNRRQAFYTDLPPANYRFRVMACNNSGVWNETGTFLDFTIDAAYYQTNWFRVLIAIAVLLLLVALNHLRVRQVERQVRAGMEGRLDERERIARDLHDTLLQSVQGLILKFHAGVKQLPSDEPVRETMEKALDHADQVLAEGRDRVRNLRASSESLSDLPAAFKRVAEEIPEGRKSTFKTVVEGNVRELHPLVQEESYSIGREAILNALTHSGGHHVEVEITYEPRQFRLRVRDDGHGIDKRTLEEGGRPDHWGIQGMRERANKIGAELKLWSGHDTGTEVELIVPGSTAYQAAAANSKPSWFRRFSGRDS